MALPPGDEGPTAGVSRRMRLSRVVDTPSRVALVAALCAVTLAVAFVAVSGGDASRLVHASPPVTDPVLAPESLTVRPGPEGFDGQYYYRSALDPLATDERVGGVAFDLPAYRSQRVLYPLLARATSMGLDAAVPWTLLAVNVAALTVVAWVGALVAVDLGRPPGWGLLFAAYPGFVYSLGFDLAEVLEAALVLAGLYAVRRHRPVVAAAALTAAVLTRETGIILPFGLGLAWGWAWLRSAWDDRPPLVDLVPAVVPAVVLVLWQAAMRLRFDAFPFAAGSDNNLSVPLGGLVDAADRFWPPSSGANLFRIVSLAVLAAVAVGAALAWRRSRADLGARLAWIVSVVLLLSVSSFVFAGATSFMRAGTESYLFGLVVILGGELSVVAMTGVGAGVVGLAALTAVSELAKAR